MCQTLFHEKYLWIILIQWLKFLFLTYNFIFVSKLHFPHISFNLRLRISYLRSSQLLYIFKEYIVLVVFPFLFLFISFYLSSFFLISHLLFFFPYFPLFFFFSQFASFPQFGLPFPKSAAPVLPHFLLPEIVNNERNSTNRRTGIFVQVM